MEHGFLWNSNSFSHDLPFLWEANGRVLVELPRQPFGDGRTYQHRNNDAGNPHDTLLIWKSMFDEFHEESKHRADLLPVPVPPLHFRPARTRQDVAQHHPAHEERRRRLVRDRQRGCALVPRRGVQGRRSRAAQGRGVVGTTGFPLEDTNHRGCGHLRTHARNGRAGAGLAVQGGAHRVAVRGRRQLGHGRAHHRRRSQRAAAPAVLRREPRRRRRPDRFGRSWRIHRPMATRS